MNKNAIKKYAIWARNELIDRVSHRAAVYGITDEDHGDPNDDSVNGTILTVTEKRQRQALIRKVNAQGFQQVMEEVAFTWFNRFAAL
ncbi:MAG TPA: restriction endonuclease, partial [Ruminococcaceae bacterium]|nr:restriction endonuclease [Oscillospiraceae bacterium]